MQVPSRNTFGQRLLQHLEISPPESYLVTTLTFYSSPKSVVRLRGFVRKDSVRTLSHNPFRIAISAFNFGNSITALHL